MRFYCKIYIYTVLHTLYEKWWCLFSAFWVLDYMDLVIYCCGMVSEVVYLFILWQEHLSFFFIQGLFWVCCCLFLLKQTTTQPHQVFFFFFFVLQSLSSKSLYTNRASLKIQFKYGNTHWISVCHKIVSHSIIRENNLQTITEKGLYYLHLLTV